MIQVVTGVILLGVAGVLAFLEYRSANDSADVMLAVTLRQADYAAPFETCVIDVSKENLGIRIRAAAPLHDSWMSVGVVAVDAAGHDVTGIQIGLSRYRYATNGYFRWAGRESQAHFLTLPSAGTYRFRLTVSAGTGASPSPDPTRAAGSLRVEALRNRTRTAGLGLLGSVAAALAGVALLLHSAAEPGRHEAESARKASESHPVANRRAEGRMVFLDGLRGIACLGVLACHLFVPDLSAVAKSLTETLPAGFAAWARHGDLGVEIFFVLSGFVIAYSLRRHRVNASLALRFVARRAVRLDPPYYAALLVAGAIAASGMPGSLQDFTAWIEGAPGMLANALYLQDILRYPSPISVAWTLCLEIQFYLAYLTLLWAVHAVVRLFPANENTEPQGLTGLVLLLLAGPLLAWSVHAWYSSANNFSFSGTWFRFSLGVLAFWATQVRVLRPALIGAAVVIGVTSALNTDPRGGVAAATALLIFLASETGRLTRWLAGRGWQHLGRISYSLYLAHVVVGLPLMNWIWGAVPHSPGWAGLMAVVGIAASLGAAESLHRLIEAPALRLSQRIRYS